MHTLGERNSTSICETCTLKKSGFLCHLAEVAAKEIESIKSSSFYPAGSPLFLENEPARGIFLLCSGKVKLSVSSRGGKTLILRLARPGEILGLSASMSGTPYEVSAEALHPSKIVFIRREDFVGFVNRFPEVYQAVTRQLNFNTLVPASSCVLWAYRQARMRKWPGYSCTGLLRKRRPPEAAQIKVALTHEQIAECVGSTRETITRTLSEFKNKHLVTLKGTTVTIPSRSALQAVCRD